MVRVTPPRRRSAAPALAVALLAAAAVLPPLPAAAQTAEPAPESEAAPPLGEAARRALENLLEDLRPVFDALRATIEDLPRYGPPEILPNGDILIPRLDRPEAPDSAPPAPGEDPDGAERLDL